MDPVLSSGKAGNVAEAWWQAAADRDDGFAAAEMELQRVLADMDIDEATFATDSDLKSKIRSGEIASWCLCAFVRLF